LYGLHVVSSFYVKRIGPHLWDYALYKTLYIILSCGLDAVAVGDLSCGPDAVAVGLLHCALDIMAGESR
jgi:hypothetical protein